MRLCYFLMVHQRPEQFARLLRALDDPADLFIVHVDASSAPAVRERFFEIGLAYPNLHFLRSQKMLWGHWSLAEAHRRAIALALNFPGWEYMINLSGSCYPLKPVSEIKDRLSLGYVEAPQDLGCVEAPNSTARLRPNYVGLDDPRRLGGRMQLRYRLYWLRLGKKLLALPAWRNPPRSVDSRNKGPNWAIIHRNFCRWLDYDPITEELSRFLRNAKLPEEFWLQWLLASSPFRCTQQPNLHFVRWCRGERHPCTITQDDMNDLRKSDALFGRKFDLDQDSRVLDMLDASFA